MSRQQPQSHRSNKGYDFDQHLQNAIHIVVNTKVSSYGRAVPRPANCNKCYHCGCSSHFIKDCPVKKQCDNHNHGVKSAVPHANVYRAKVAENRQTVDRREFENFTIEDRIIQAKRNKEDVIRLAQRTAAIRAREDARKAEDAAVAARRRNGINNQSKKH